MTPLHAVFLGLVVFALSRTIFDHEQTSDNSIFSISGRNTPTTPRQGCVVTITCDLNSGRTPIFLNQNEQLWPTDSRSQLHWAPGETTKLLCSGPGNFLTRSFKPVTRIQCVSNNIFKLDEEPPGPLGELKCNDKVTGDVQEAYETCGDGGRGSLLNIGFSSRSEHLFVPFIQVCYNHRTGSTLFTHHTFHGQSSVPKCPDGNSPTFRTNGQSSSVTQLTVAYSQGSQKTRFGNVSPFLGSLFEQTMLEKGHLTPKCDGLFTTWQHATMFYINAAPMWKQVNRENWVKVENMVRTQAKRMQRSLQIFTGTHEVLHLDGVDMSLLRSGLVEVPKYFWKVIRDPYSGRGIALYTLNYNLRIPMDRLCNQINCVATKWVAEGFSDFAKGAIYCCDVNDFMDRVASIPRQVKATGLLEFTADQT